MSTPSSPRVLRLSERSSSLADPQYDRSPPLQRSPRSAAATSPGAQAQSPGLVQSPSRSRPPPALDLGRDHGPSTVSLRSHSVASWNDVSGWTELCEIAFDAADRRRAAPAAPWRQSACDLVIIPWSEIVDIKQQRRPCLVSFISH